MEQNSNENVAPAEGAPTPDEEVAAERPVRRRASRRVTTAAGAQAAEAAPPADAASPAGAGASEAPSEAAAEPAAEAPKKRASRARKKVADADAPEGSDAAVAPASEEASASAGAAAVEGAAETAPADAAPADAAPAETAPVDAPKKRATRSRKKAAEPETDGAEQAEATGAAQAGADAAEAPAAGAEASEAPVKRTSRSRKTRAEAAEAPAEQADTDASAETATAATASAEAQDAQGGAESTGSRRGRRGSKGVASAQGDAVEASADQGAEQSSDAESESANGRDAGARSGKGRDGKGRNAKKQNGKNEGAQNEEAKGNGGKGENAKADGANGDNGKGDGSRGENAKNERGGDKNGDANARSSRTRQRDRKRRGQNDEFELEITEDDVLLPIAGILDVLDNYAFVRTSGYLPGASDVYVSLGQVKKHGLRKGDAIVGAIRQPREGEGSGRQKYNALVKLDTVNGQPIEDDAKRVDFAELTAIYPQDRLRLESGAERIAARAIDLFAPIGKGQRGLVVGAQPAPVLREIAAGVAANNPEAHLMLVLLDERPEEATEAQRTVKGEVIASTFDRLSEDHVTVAELAVERAKRLVELGHDVVLLIDSLTALARAYVQNHPHRGAAVDAEAAALHQVRKLIGAARNIENGGSLTILAAALTKTGVKADKALLRGLAGVANTEIRLEKTLPGREPIVNPSASLTLGAGAMLGAAEAVALDRLRGESSGDDAAERVVDRLRATSSNAALLAELQRS